MLVVTPGDGFAYLQAMAENVFPVETIRGFVDVGGKQRTRPVVIIDFDRAMLVSTYGDQALEDAVGDGWDGHYGEVLDHIPEELAAHWR